MKFTKMHGLGNDYLYVFGEVPENIKELAVRLSDRHFGAGSDGMIYISPSSDADFKMRIFNADGSEAKMCGNGIRCVGKYVYDRGFTDKKRLNIETLSGIKELELTVSDGKVQTVSVDMGTAVVEEDLQIPIPDFETLAEKCNYLAVDPPENGVLQCVPVNVGNPHAVFFVTEAEAVALNLLGPLIEHHNVFDDGVNAEFVQLLSKNKLRMRVWERGSGITMACGTGACASAAAAAAKGICDYNVPIEVVLDGGSLEIVILKSGKVLMTGPAVTVYDAEYPVV